MPDGTALGRSNLNLNLCFTKIKLPPIFSQSTTAAQTQTSQHRENNDDDHDHRGKPTMIKNFNTLYEEDTSSRRLISSAELATAYATRRFFMSSPGESNSIVDSSSADVALSVAAVPKMSPDPYADFRRSMEEMMEARKEKPSSEFLNELLLCYLALNPETAHNFIVRAFSDLVATLFPSNNT